MIRNMATSESIIAALGCTAVQRWRTFQVTGRLAGRAVVEALSPRFYGNSATRSVVAKQIYFTAWQILPAFTLFAAMLSFVLIEIVVSTARDFGLSEYALEMTVRVLVIEIIPLLTALFVATRSGAAINTEVALMHIHNELEGLRQAGIDAMRFELVPRVIGGAVSVLALTAISSSVALVIALLLVYGPQPWAWAEFGQVLARIFTPLSVIGLWLKVLLFGVVVTVIPIASGLQVPRKLFFAPIAVLQGMVRLFFVLMLVEVGSLALRYI